MCKKCPKIIEEDDEDLCPDCKILEEQEKEHENAPGCPKCGRPAEEGEPDCPCQ
jgi:hypothetical protein